MSKTLAILHQSCQEMGHQIQTYTSFHIIQHPLTFPPCFCQSLVALHHGPNPLTCGCVVSDSLMNDNSTSGRWPVAIPGVLHCRTYLRCLKQTLTLRHKASSSNIEERHAAGNDHDNNNHQQQNNRNNNDKNTSHNNSITYNCRRTQPTSHKLTANYCH